MTADHTAVDDLVPLDLLDERPTSEDQRSGCRWPYLHRPVTSAKPEWPSRSRWGSSRRPGSKVSERRL